MNRYQEVRTTQVSHLASAWFRGDEDVAKKIGEKVDKKIDGYVNGELDHAMETMALLWEFSRGKKNSSGNSEGTVSHLGCQSVFCRSLTPICRQALRAAAAAFSDTTVVCTLFTAPTRG